MLWADYKGHVFTRNSSLSTILISDKEFPSRVAFAVLNKVADDFLIQFPSPNQWAINGGAIVMQGLKETMAKYQNPSEADSLMKVQKELDETKIIMVRWLCMSGTDSVA